MSRHRKHKVKREKPEPSTSSLKTHEDYDLTYYIHDRVELMHQVFSVIKPKDLKALAPECVRQISNDDLQELCTEELLGISSKRLCAILDGADPPSDTESSSNSQSPERMETISLDSISSDEEILSQVSSKKSKKHKHRHRRKSKEQGAARAGLTVLELLELQARARAIRAQLHQDQAARQVSEVPESSQHSDHDDVEIKEETAEVVEISSDEEKPDINKLTAVTEASVSTEPKKQSHTVTKRINELVITVPQAKPSRKIKLNRSKISTPVSNSQTNPVTVEKPADKPVAVNEANKTTENTKEDDRTMEKTKKKTKKKEKKKGPGTKGSDDDEITLQLSDTEKMDLLEDLDRKNYDKLSTSEDSESSSETDSSSDERQKRQKAKLAKANSKAKVVIDKDNSPATEIVNKDLENAGEINTTESAQEGQSNTNNDGTNSEIDQNEVQKNNVPSSIDPMSEDLSVNVTENVDKSEHPNKEQENLTVANILDVTEVKEQPENIADNSQNQSQEASETNNKDNQLETKSQANISSKEDCLKSDGELSDRESSEVEECELKPPDVVCISDEDGDKKSHKKKKKKEKKCKKAKKSKKTKPDFPESSDQNFFRENEVEGQANVPEIQTGPSVTKTEDNTGVTATEANNGIGGTAKEIDLTSQEAGIEKDTDAKETKSGSGDGNSDALEILELSDDSSCYEVGLLSKEPTTEEIEALSAKIDQIEREDVVTDNESQGQNEQEHSVTEEELENISWKDRYLESKKVKKVMSTSSIFNALRKKNRELKKKLEESKNKVEEPAVKPTAAETVDIEEGTIEHFNTLEGSTKYVAPVEPPDKPNVEEENPKVSREMKKDAKQLLKMYKKLLMYNDMTKQRDPSKKKKKTKKKKRDDKKSETSAETVT